MSAPRGGVCSWGVSAPGGCLLPGVSAQGVSAPRGVFAPGGCVCSQGGVSAPGGCVCSRGGLLWWVSAPGGVSALGGSAPGGCIPACTEADTPLWTESQTPVKTLPWPNFVAAGNDVCKHETQILYCYSLFCKQ